MANAMVSDLLRSCLLRRHKTRFSLAHWVSQWFQQSSQLLPARVICQRSANLLAAAKAEEVKAYPIDKATEPATISSGQQGRVLLIGSPNEEQQRLKRLWQSLHYDVMTARSSLGAITKKPFTLCDYVLIDVEGLQESATVAISRLAAHLQHDVDSHTRLVALTSAYDQCQRNLRDAGADYCLEKPLTREKLVEMLPTSKSVGEGECLPVLLLEDDLAQQQVMAKYFKDANHPITLAKTVTEACRLVRQHRYVLIITNMGLPDGEGVTLIEMAQHHSESKNSDTPIIAVTANAQDFRESCMVAGAEAVYPKPVSAIQVQAWFKQYGIGRLANTP